MIEIGGRREKLILDQNKNATKENERDNTETNRKVTHEGSLPTLKA